MARLVTRFGSRKVCMLGSFLAGLGTLGASFSWNLQLLLVCYSLITGLGFGLMYIPGVVACQEHFSKRRALAQGLAVCGTGMGTLLFPPFVECIIATYGWRSTFRVLSGICFGSILCGASMIPAKKSGDLPKEEEVSDDRNLEQNVSLKGWRWLLSLIAGKSLASSVYLPTFLIVMFGDFSATMALYIPYTHLPKMAMARGINAKDAAFLISAAGIGSTIGRIVAGLLCDLGSIHPMTITLIATLLASIQSFLFTRYSLIIPELMIPKS